MTDKEKEQICRWWVNHELRSNRVTFSDKVYVSTADIQDFEQFIDSLVEDSLSDKTEKAVDELSTNVANGLMEQLKEGMPERPTFKVGQKITDGKETVIVSELLDDGSIRVDTKPSGDCWFDIDVNEADKWRLIEEPANEDLEKEIDRWSQEHCYNKSEKPVFAAVARHFAKWQKEIDKLIFYNDLSEFEDIKKLVVNEIASINTIEAIDTDFDGWYNRLIVFAKRCAQWQKQQMLAKAIDAHIELGPNNNHVLMNGIFNKYEWNDKVKIIIIEEDKI